MRKIALTASIILTVAVFCLLIAKDSDAAFVNSTLNITATVPSGCAVTTTPVSFGAYLSNQPGDVLTTGAINVNCPTATNYQVDLGSGNYYTFPNSYRRMNNGGVGAMDYLNYYLYWYCNGCTLAGTGISPGFTDSGTGNLSWQTHTIYGAILGFQFVNPGSFSDSVTVTISW